MQVLSRRKETAEHVLCYSQSLNKLKFLELGEKILKQVATWRNSSLGCGVSLEEQDWTRSTKVAVVQAQRPPPNNYII